MPSPFEQNVPSTTWTTNAEGERVQVVAGASTELSANEEIQKVTQNIYDTLYDKKFAESSAKLFEKGQKLDQKDKAAMDKFGAEILTAMKPIIENVDQGKISDEKFSEALGTWALASMLVNGTMTAEIPLSAIEVVDGKGTFAMDEMKTTFDGEVIDIPKTGEKIEFVKVDGHWKATAESLFNPVKPKT